MDNATYKLSPSAHARMLFGEIYMAAGEGKKLSIEGAMKLSEDRISRGYKDEDALRELLSEKWVGTTDEGGIKIII